MTVTVNDDRIVEDSEVFIGKLRNTGEDRIEIVEDEARVTILDNDGNTAISIVSPLLISHILIFRSCCDWIQSISVHCE